MEKKLTKNDQKALLLYKSNYKMYLKTLEEVSLRGDAENIERIEALCVECLQKMESIDPDFAKQCYESAHKNENDMSYEAFKDSNADIFSQLSSIEGDDNTQTQSQNSNFADEVIATDEGTSVFDGIDPNNVNFDDLTENWGKPESVKVEIPQEEVQAEPKTVTNTEDSSVSYDIIPLPSKGECYRNKKDRIKVGYLTASDENLITSPNLYESGELINVLLKRKVLDSDVNTQDLVSGDVDAILLFLRATAYGNEFPIETTIPGTTKIIKTVADLSQLKYKPFSLTGDENGHFSFNLPVTKAEIKFKFLTKREEKLLEKLNKKENSGIASIELKEAVEKVKKVIKSDTTLSSADKGVIIDASSKLEKWSDALSKKNGVAMFTKSVTNAMEMQIVSVNGNKDRGFIHEFVMNMPARDSLAFRRYLYDNQCGVDFEVEVQKPESLGGGSFKCFLEWDDYVFWTVN